HATRLFRRHHPILETLKEDDRPVDASGVMHRGALTEHPVGGTGTGTGKGVEVARLELVGVRKQPLKIGDAVVRGAGGKDVVEGECRQHGEPAGTAAGYDQPFAIGEVLRNKFAGSGDHVLHVGDAPSAVEGFAVGAPVTGAATVIDIEIAKTAAGPVLNLRLETAIGHSGRTTVSRHDN